MGLDMYLYAERYIGVWNHSGDVKEADWAYRHILKLAGFPDFLNDGDGRSLEVKVKVGYWRKANAIHHWFVDNCQKGEDECQDTYVEREQLVTLKELCQELLRIKSESLAMEKLPPQPGFFFGSTDIDSYYWQDLEDTVRILSLCLDSPDLKENCQFIYHSSW